MADFDSVLDLVGGGNTGDAKQLWVRVHYCVVSGENDGESCGAEVVRLSRPRSRFDKFQLWKGPACSA